jgi:hypothetical protein
LTTVKRTPAGAVSMTLMSLMCGDGIARVACATACCAAASRGEAANTVVSGFRRTDLAPRPASPAAPTSCNALRREILLMNASS